MRPASRRTAASARGGAFSVTMTSVVATLERIAGAVAAGTATRRTTTAARPRFRKEIVRGYTVPPRGGGGIGRRARFRSVWGKPRGGSSPLIRIFGLGWVYRLRPSGKLSSMIILLLLLAALVVFGIVLAVAVIKWLFILAVVAALCWIILFFVRSTP